MTPLHKTFGTPAGAYVDRPGAYILPIEDGKIALVCTPKGLFFLGGGMENGETREETIRRECLEETGCMVSVGKLICSADAYTKHWGDVPYHPVQYYYLGAISPPVQPPLEQDHQLLWLDFEDARGKLFSPMQNWALEMLLEEMAAYSDGCTEI